MENIAVSVIIPAYNTEDYIEKAVYSALDQSIDAIEVIAVDDCSTDGTAERLLSISDPRLKVLLNDSNQGAGAARNRAIDAARGQWIAVLDSDDWFAPTRIEDLIAEADHHNADMVADDLLLIEDDNETPWSTMIAESGEVIETSKVIEAAEFLNSSIEGSDTLKFGFTKPLFKRDFLEKHRIRYDRTIKVTQDFWFAMACLREGAKFVLSPKAGYYYRARPGSLITGDKIRRLQDEIRAIDDLLEHRMYLTDNPDVMTALVTKREATETWLNYYEFVEPLKRGNFKVILSHPKSRYRAIRHFASQLPSIIERRLERYRKRGERSYQRSVFRRSTSRASTARR